MDKNTTCEHHRRRRHHHHHHHHHHRRRLRRPPSPPPPPPPPPPHHHHHHHHHPCPSWGTIITNMFIQKPLQNPGFYFPICPRGRQCAILVSRIHWKFYKCSLVIRALMDYPKLSNPSYPECFAERVSATGHKAIALKLMYILPGTGTTLESAYLISQKDSTRAYFPTVSRIVDTAVKKQVSSNRSFKQFTLTFNMKGTLDIHVPQLHQS